MKEFPKEWCTDVCPEVVKWLKEKHNTAYTGTYKFYGVRNYAWSSNTIFGTYISHKEFMELAGLCSKEPIMKLGDMVWVDDVSVNQAMYDKHSLKLLAILPEKQDERYICDEEDGSFSSWKFAILPTKEEKKERKLVLTDSEWEKVQKLYS